jgi:hypothetical protein
VWRIYEGSSTPLLRSFLTPLTLTPVYDGTAQALSDIGGYTASIASPDSSQILGSVSGLTISSSAIAGSYTAALTQNLSSTQQGYDIDARARTITGTGSAANDIILANALAWQSGRLTLNAQRSIHINATLNGSGTARLALDYGQAAVAAGNTSDYSMQAVVNLPAGNNFNTQLGSDGAVKNYTVITSLGAAGSNTGTDLQGMNGALSANYALGGNIDAAATSTWNASAGFATVGNTGTPFNGTFDGLGHTISGLTINRPANAYVGLFGATGASASLRNVGLVGGSIVGSSYTGALVGRDDGAIRNSYTTASVSGGSAAYVGGMVGLFRSGGTISDSYAGGSVSGGVYIGGLVGLVNSGAAITNSYATGTVTGSSSGGLAGLNQGAISHSYATGSIVGSGGGGLVGNSGGSITDSVWNTTTSGKSASSGGGTGLTTAQMTQASSFAGWDLASASGSAAVWRIYEGSTAPLLRSFLTPITLTPVYDGTAQTLSSIGDYTASIASPDSSKILGTVSGLTISSSASAGSQTAALNQNLSSTQQGYDIQVLARTVTGTGSAANDITLANTLSWASGRLTLDAVGNVNLNANLSGTASGASILAKAGASIRQATDVVITTSGGNVTYNSDSDADQNGSIQLKNRTQIVTGGGNIVMGGGLDPATTAAYGTGATVSGIELFDTSNPWHGGNPAATLNAGGGNIRLTGTGTGSAGNGISSNVAVQMQTRGSGSIDLVGSATGGGVGVVIDRTEIRAVNGNVMVQGTVASSSVFAVTEQEAAGITSTGSGNISVIGIGGLGLEIGSGTAPTFGGTSHSGNVLLRGNQVVFTGPSTVNTSGTLTIDSPGTSFSAALNTSSLAVNARVSGLTLGKAGNTADITIGRATSLAGPINLQGGNINLNANLSSMLAGASILAKARGNIVQANNVVVSTQAGDITYWA